MQAGGTKCKVALVGGNWNNGTNAGLFNWNVNNTTCREVKIGKTDSKVRNTTTDVLLKICNVLDCDFADIMEVDRSENKHKE